jgi:hypothetical protein
MYYVTTHDVREAAQIQQQYKEGTLPLDQYEHIVITVVRRAFEQTRPIDRKTLDAFHNLTERM